MNNGIDLTRDTYPGMPAGYDPSAPILSCVNLNKSYVASRPVLHNLNISLTGGKIVGLLGPNGCGKSTLLKLVSGILVPDSGTIEVCGVPQSEATNSLISFLPERTYFNSWMRVEQLIEYFSDFFADFDEAMARKMLADLSIDTSAKLKTLSKGNKEKVCLILVMSRNAQLYVLDEPIAGVDPAARDYVISTIIHNYNPDATVLISTHLIADIEQILDEVIFLKNGSLVLQKTVDEIREEHGKSVDELFREVFKW